MEKGQKKKGDALRLSWLPTGECAHVRVHVQDKSKSKSSDQAAAGLRGGFGRQLEPL